MITMATTATGKPGITQRMGKFTREAWVELKKTSWPSKEELQKSTLLVIAAIIVVAIWIGGLDFIFGVVTRKFVGW
jgi:preprotein translocase subunit SecE